MLRLAADHNFNRHIIRGLLRRIPTIDIVHLADVGLTRTPDPDVLAWCAETGRVLLTHDVSTMTRYAYERVDSGLLMPGVVEVNNSAPIGEIIDDLRVLVECSFEGEWKGQVVYLPF